MDKETQLKGRMPEIGGEKGSANVYSLPSCASQETGSQGVERNAEQIAEKVAELRPCDLSEAETVVWDRVCAHLLEVQRMKALFVDSLAQYCRVLVRMEKTRLSLNTKQWTYETEGRHGTQHKSRPEVAQLNDDFRKFMQLTSHFGLTPATELRYAAGKQGELFDDDF